MRTPDLSNVKMARQFVKDKLDELEPRPENVVVQWVNYSFNSNNFDDGDRSDNLVATLLNNKRYHVIVVFGGIVDEYDQEWVTARILIK
jgi:hypothetical protein